ncbi:MAG: flap endonuclease [Deltaproteobacteria bacterium]|nr:flap endonuclease [Deltaproteobacteria bacterium]
MDLHLVDGTYELFRAYFSAPEAESKDGIEVGAVRGVLQTLLQMTKKEGATHLAVAFDTVIESFRNDLYDGYKTGEGIEDDLGLQFPLVEEGAEALGFVVWRMREFEADDALSAFAHQARAFDDVETIHLCTPDKDLAQSVEERTKGKRTLLVDRRRKISYDEDGVLEKFGVPPAAVPDYLALVGDAADGIPGIPRWGAKSTSQVLREYGSLEKIPLDEKYWRIKVRGATTLAENLREEYEEAKLYKKLATLRLDVSFDENPVDLLWRGADRAKLEAFADKLAWPRILERCHRYQDE